VINLPEPQRPAHLYDGWVQAVEVQHDHVLVIQAFLGLKHQTSSVLGALAACLLAQPSCDAGNPTEPRQHMQSAV
jgi:hypothetical protein